MGYKALSSLELIELIISQCFWSLCIQIYRRMILRCHLVTPSNGRIVPENDFSLRCTSLLTIAIPNQHGLLKCLCYIDGRRSSSLPGPLQVELFLSVCWLYIYFQLLIFLPDLNHLKWNFPCLVSQAALFGKTKWFSYFGVWVRENMCCFAHTEKLCWPTSPCPISPVVLCCFVLFSLIALHAVSDLHVNNVVV